MKKNSWNYLDSIFGLAVVFTVMLSWAAVQSQSTDACTLAFVSGAVGLIAALLKSEDT